MFCGSPRANRNFGDLASILGLLMDADELAYLQILKALGGTRYKSRDSARL